MMPGVTFAVLKGKRRSNQKYFTRTSLFFNLSSGVNITPEYADPFSKFNEK